VPPFRNKTAADVLLLFYPVEWLFAGNNFAGRFSDQTCSSGNLDSNCVIEDDLHDSQSEKKEPPAGVSRWLGEEVGDRVVAGV
jgi:hypothetical protein